MSFDPRALLRGRHPISPADAARGAAGALLGIAATGLLARALAGGGPHLSPLLIPPIGASAVLVFAVPASPLAQPRCVIGGNILSAVVGVTCALLLPQPALAAAVAVGMAILLMSLLGCLHPPGGAVALGAALAGAAGGPAAYAFALAPVGLCSVLLVVAGMAYARASRRSYPHRAPAAAPAANTHGSRDRPPSERVGYTPADLDSALAHYGELLDVSREDLDALFRQVELAAHRRIHSEIRCGDIMSRDVISVDAHQTAESALSFLQQHDLRTAPVIDVEGRVVGMVRRAELLAGRRRLVEQVLDPFVHRVRPSTPIEALLPLLSSGQAHEAMVVDENRVLVGVITQTDLLAVLYRAHIVEQVASMRAA
ncbi:HPP family protein [Phenylobacterium deserti]|uniref:HPP family protein n=1 Tax=Phenylobacterium deserti TaxID=1914756 RepID=A0A328AV71_9CAUL|nr:HPP family protein [Phenylobacterium deserti]RAK58105.1 HPP family protein [Phenylobacterium deserti]